MIIEDLSYTRIKQENILPNHFILFLVWFRVDVAQILKLTEDKQFLTTRTKPSNFPWPEFHGYIKSSF